MLVYRLEDDEGNGPYEYHSQGSKLHNSSHILPCPHSRSEKRQLRDFWNKTDYTLREHYQCGFSSLEQLFAWFDKRKLKCYHNQTIKISIYDVKETHMIDGYYQCIFLREDSRLAQRVSLTALHDLEIDQELRNRLLIGHMKEYDETNRQD